MVITESMQEFGHISTIHSHQRDPFMPYSDPTFVGLLFVEPPKIVRVTRHAMEQGTIVKDSDFESVTMEASVVRTYKHGCLLDYPEKEHFPDSIQHALATFLNVKQHAAEDLWRALELSEIQLRLVTHV